MGQDAAASGTPRIQRIRTLLIGDRLDVLERRIEILARNLGKEVETARDELRRRFGPLEERLLRLEETQAAGLAALRTAVEDRLEALQDAPTDRPGAEVRGFARRLDEGLARERKLAEAEHLRARERHRALSDALARAIQDAVAARGALRTSLRAELERATKAGLAELERVDGALRAELARLRTEVAEPAGPVAERSEVLRDGRGDGAPREDGG